MGLLDTIHGLQGENPWVQVNPRAFQREGGMYLCSLTSDGYFREFLAPGLGGVAHGVQSSGGGRGVGSLLCVWGGIGGTYVDREGSEDCPDGFVGG